MVSSFIRKVARHLLNRPGWTTNRKIVVVESDDWGSIRMPSTGVYNELLRHGVPVGNSPYCRFDSLASEKDLELLFELLSGFKDRSGRHPAITANVVVSNPDFDKIRESNFKEYFCEPITETFKKYPEHAGCMELWKSGNRAGIFHPQSHGKEHLNVAFWLKLLQKDLYHFRLAFDHHCWGLSSDVYPDLNRSIQASFDIESGVHLPIVEDAIRDGLGLFEELFGYRSESFIANNFIWSSSLNRVLKEEGVHYLQGMKYQKLPLLNGNRRKMIRHYLGEKNEFGQYYLIRNCTFEPSINGPEFDSVDDCLNGIATAFFWKKPAIISTHRINYVGFLDIKNRDKNLRQLKIMLQEILKRWPDVEFVTSDMLGRIIENKNEPEYPAVNVKS